MRQKIREGLGFGCRKGRGRREEVWLGICDVHMWKRGKS